MSFPRTFPLSVILTATLMMAVAFTGTVARVTVSISNQFPTDSPVEVTALCESANTKLNKAVITPDIAFSFDFDPNIFGSTLFHCMLTRSDIPGAVVRFDAYNFQRDYAERCKSQCVWNVSPGGVFGIDQSNNTVDVKVSWGPGAS